MMVYRSPAWWSSNTVHYHQQPRVGWGTILILSSGKIPLVQRGLNSGDGQGGLQWAICCHCGIQDIHTLNTLWHTKFKQHTSCFQLISHSILGLLESDIYILKTHIPVLLFLLLSGKSSIVLSLKSKWVKNQHVFMMNICPYQNGGSCNNYCVSRQQHYKWIWISITTDYSNSSYSSQTTTASGKHNSTTCNQTGDTSESTFSNQETNLKIPKMQMLKEGQKTHAQI